LIGWAAIVRGEQAMLIRFVALAVLLVCAAGDVWAQAWPSRPIRVLIPFGAGSATDIVPRIVFDQLSPALGQPIVVENRVGGGGTVAAGAVAKAAPDGYTLLATSSAHTIVPAIHSNIAYDAAGDFSAVIAFGSVPNVLIISPAKGIKTIQELVAAAKAKPSSFNYASVGVGSATHLSVEGSSLLPGSTRCTSRSAGDPKRLPRSLPGALNSISVRSTRRCPISATASSPRWSSTARSARLRCLRCRLQSRSIWLGMLAPAKTPRAIVERLHGETAKVLAQPAIQEKLTKTGIEPLVMAPAEFDARIAAEVAANRALVKAAGIKTN
jgi:tripartite-type tricarboxylate transporter receptor subunit TctC